MKVYTFMHTPVLCLKTLTENCATAVDEPHKFVVLVPFFISANELVWSLPAERSPIIALSLRVTLYFTCFDHETDTMTVLHKVRGTRYKVRGTRYEVQGTRYTAEKRKCEKGGPQHLSNPGSILNTNTVAEAKRAVQTDRWAGAMHLPSLQYPLCSHNIIHHDCSVQMYASQWFLCRKVH